MTERDQRANLRVKLWGGTQCFPHVLASSWQHLSAPWHSRSCWHGTPHTLLLKVPDAGQLPGFCSLSAAAQHRPYSAPSAVCERGFSSWIVCFFFISILSSRQFYCCATNKGLRRVAIRNLKLRKDWGKLRKFLRPLRVLVRPRTKYVRTLSNLKFKVFLIFF